MVNFKSLSQVAVPQTTRLSAIPCGGQLPPQPGETGPQGEETSRLAEPESSKQDSTAEPLELPEPALGLCPQDAARVHFMQ